MIKGDQRCNQGRSSVIGGDQGQLRKIKGYLRVIKGIFKGDGG